MKEPVHMGPLSLDPEAPWYVKLTTGILSTSGPITLIALAFTGFLMYLVLVQFKAVLDNQKIIQDEMAAAKVSMAGFVTAQRDYDVARQRMLELQLRILRQVCINGARDSAAMKACAE
jgi:hypothetical protein